MDKWEINRKPLPRPVCKSREREKERERRSDESSESVRAKDINTARFSLFREKGDRKRSADEEEGELPPECARRKGRVQCGGIEWSEKSNGADPRCVERDGNEWKKSAIGSSASARTSTVLN